MSLVCFIIISRLQPTDLVNIHMLIDIATSPLTCKSAVPLLCNSDTKRKTVQIYFYILKKLAKRLICRFIMTFDIYTILCKAVNDASNLYSFDEER
jgi:hypothetical protein